MHRLFTILLIALSLVSGTAQGALYIVNTFDVDLPQADMNLANCDARVDQAGDQCTLRAAVMLANANPAPGPHTIALPLDVTIVLNRTGNGGAEEGDLDITAPMIISGALADLPADISRLPLILSSTGDRIFDVSNGANVTFRGLRLSGGEANLEFEGSGGGAIRIASPNSHVIVDTVRFSNNYGTRGGAISSRGTLEIIDSDFGNNSTLVRGAHLYVRGDGDVTVRRSSFRFSSHLGPTSEAIGMFTGARLTLENSMVDGAPLPIGGTPTSGVTADRPARLWLRNSTLAGFTDHGVDVTVDDDTDIRIFNSVIAYSGDPGCKISGSLATEGSDPRLQVEDSLIQTFDCYGDGPGFGFKIGSNVQIGVDPLLQPMTGEPGSFVFARRIAYGSPAVDSGVAPGGSLLVAGRECLALDIRNQPRPQDGDGDGEARCDLGAVEAPAIVTFVVNVADVDAVDANPGDGVCETAPGNGQCTLRAAVMEANALPGRNNISIPLPGQTISLTIPSAPGPGDHPEHGDLDIVEPLTITGVIGDPAQRPRIHANHGDRIFTITSSDVSLRGLRLSGGGTTSYGGAAEVYFGAENVLFEEVEMFNNAAEQGGGALLVVAADVTLVRSDLRNNTTTGRGGAIMFGSGVLTLVDSSVRGNLNLSPEDQREAIHVNSSGILVLNNSTISSNDGDGINISNGTLSANNATIVHNSGHGIDFERRDGESLSLRNTVLAYNAQLGCAASGAGAATISTNAYNLSQGDGCAIQSGATNIIDPEPLLGPLQIGSGDFSAYHVPLTGSPLIDSGSNVFIIGCRLTDQLGTLRPVDGDGDGNARCDIGAIEVGPITDAIFANGFED